MSQKVPAMHNAFIKKESPLIIKTMEEKYINVTSKLGRDRWFQFPKPLEVSEWRHNLISIVFYKDFWSIY